MIKSIIENAINGNLVSYGPTFFANPSRFVDMRIKYMLKQVVIKIFGTNFVVVI